MPRVSEKRQEESQLNPTQTDSRGPTNVAGHRQNSIIASMRIKRKHVSGIPLEAGLLEWSSTVIEDSLEGFSLFSCELATL